MRFKGHKLNVGAIAFAPDGKRLAANSQDGTVKLWDLASGQELITLKVTTSASTVFRVAFSPDGKRLAASAGTNPNTGTLMVWSAASDGDAPVRRK